jgi:hypothetical protein
MVAEIRDWMVQIRDRDRVPTHVLFGDALRLRDERSESYRASMSEVGI